MNGSCEQRLATTVVGPGISQALWWASHTRGDLRDRYTVHSCVNTDKATVMEAAPPVLSVFVSVIVTGLVGLQTLIFCLLYTIFYRILIISNNFASSSGV